VTVPPTGSRLEDPLPDVPSDRELVARIRAEIEAAGPMTFARFMELALYDPEHGYYSSATDRPTRAGDFLTAPELHPIFGRALARQVVDVWQRLAEPDGFTIREFGAGSGTLAVALLERIALEAPRLAATLRYEPVEHNRHRRDDLRRRFETAGLADRLASGGQPFGPMTGVVVANEFVDALPVHRVVGDPTATGGIAELFVVADGDAFREEPAAPSTPALATRLEVEGVSLGPGQRGEVRLADDAWIRDVAEDLRQGVVLVVDYGLPASELYAPSRTAGTLVAYLGHRAHGDPFRSVGRQDLTAHVDLTALEAAAAAAGLDRLGDTTQAEFLVGTGLEALLEEVRSDPTTTLGGWAALRSAVARLLDPRATGAFRVVVLGRGVAAEPALAGLGFQLPSRRARAEGLSTEKRRGS